jgi:hypothetical protein
MSRAGRELPPPWRPGDRNLAIRSIYLAVINEDIRSSTVHEFHCANIYKLFQRKNLAVQTMILFFQFTKSTVNKSSGVKHIRFLNVPNSFYEYRIWSKTHQVFKCTKILYEYRLWRTRPDQTSGLTPSCLMSGQ